MILKASLEHAELLSQLGAETFYASHKNSAPTYELNNYMKNVYSLNSIRNELSNPLNIYHIIWHDDTAAGFSKIAFNVSHRTVMLPHVSKMDQLYLLEPYHGKKLGAQLLEYNIEYSKTHGQNGMWLVVWIGNTKAINVYEKFGFRIVSRDEFHLTDTHLSPCYIMCLEYDKSTGH